MAEKPYTNLIDRSSALSQEPIAEKLRREADLVFGGLGDGLKSSAQAALEAPFETAGKVGISAAVGYGLTAMQGRAGMLRLAAEVGGLALGYAFVKDVASRASVTSEAFVDTWHSGQNQARNREIVASTLGPFAFDFAITSAGGLAGIGLAKNSSWLAKGSETETRQGAAQLILGSQKPELVPRYKAVHVEGTGNVELPVLTPDYTLTNVRAIDLPVQSPIAKAYAKTAPGVGRVEVLAHNGEGGVGGNFGTSFALGENKMATAAHVVDGAVDITVFDALNNAHAATVTGIDRNLDVAILSLTDATVFKPLKLAESATAVDEQAFAMGFPNGWNQLYASPGIVESLAVRHMIENRMLFKMVSEAGNSGGPIVNEAGEVIAVLTSGARNSQSQTFGTSTAFLKPLLEKSPITSTDSFVDKPFSISSIAVPNKVEGAKNLEALFGRAMYGEMPLDFFHSRVKRVPLPGSKDSELAIAAQFRPAENAVVVKPIAIDGLPISPTAQWHLTGLPIRGSSLRVTLDNNNLPVLMELINDPHTILQQVFMYRNSNGYLAGLHSAKH